MTAVAFIHCRVTPETKVALRAAAEQQRLSESGFIKRALEFVLQTATPANLYAVPARPTRSARLYARLTLGDRALLQERAAARHMPSATYASMLLRAHLRAHAPLTKDELTELRRSASELRAIGVNLNQIARMAHQSGRISGPTRDDLRAFLKVCEGLRDHIRALIQANARSWESGDAQPHR
jgi:uncharacterized protein (DUF1778 family)